MASQLEEAILETLLKGSALEELIQETINKRLETPKVYEFKREGDKSIVEGHFHKDFEMILNLIQCGNVFVIGPTGCGKTTIGQQCAEALSLPFHFNGAIQQEFKLLGYMDAHGNYMSTPFRKAYEDGGVYLFDEIDGSRAEVLLTVNAALANGQMDFPDKTIDRHPDFYCIAAANTYGNGKDRNYVGRNQLDAATLDRFIIFEMDYDEELEKEIAIDAKWAKFVISVRHAVAKLNLRHIISPRASIDGAKMIRKGIPVEQVKKIKVW